MNHELESGTGAQAPMEGTTDGSIDRSGPGYFLRVALRHLSLINQMRIGFCKHRRFGPTDVRIVDIDPLVGLASRAPIVQAGKKSINPEFPLKSDAGMPINTSSKASKPAEWPPGRAIAHMGHSHKRRSTDAQCAPPQPASRRFSRDSRIEQDQSYAAGQSAATAVEGAREARVKQPRRRWVGSQQLTETERWRIREVGSGGSLVLRKPRTNHDHAHQTDRQFRGHERTGDGSNRR
jgi:hypothetical protein